jgi:fructoselysine 6-kinase
VAIRAVTVGDNCIDSYVYPIKKEFVGGNAVNVAVALHRNGISSSYVGVVGDDEYGGTVLEGLEAAGVDVSHSRRLKGETAVTTVELRNGDRVFLEERLGVTANLTLDEETLEFIARHRLVHNTHLGHTARLVPRFRDADLLVSFDYSTMEDREIVRETIEHVDIAFASFPEQDLLKAIELAKALVAHGPRIAVVTMGEAGSVAFDGQHVWRQLAVPVEGVVDTLGAGDTFIGTFLGGWLKGQDTAVILQEAAVQAANNCKHFGGWIAKENQA